MNTKKRYSTAPLADRMRPHNIEEILGQKHLLGTDSVLRSAILSGHIFPVIFWGPPGSGKTTLARLISQHSKNPLRIFSAVTSGVKDLRKVVAEAEKEKQSSGRSTIIFVDEIHRFNKAQQDAFLPHVESGLLILVGATTQNPSFEVIPPLLSRTRVMTLHPLGKDDIKTILNRALQDKENGLGETGVGVLPDAMELLTISLPEMPEQPLITLK